MLALVLSLIVAARVFFQTRADIAIEALALRQQVAVLKRKRPRPPLRPLDRLFWTVLRGTWSRWRDALVIVKPETVVGCHRAGFRLYWRWRSRPRGGRPRITPEVRALIRRLAQENTNWGAPKIHGELQKLGFVLSERTVARYLSGTQRRGDAGKKWLAFLHNHREAIVAFDFFTVPTATFRILYCFFVIEHERRSILHFNVTRCPSADWVVQQLRETFPEAVPYRYAILDHDSIFNGDVIAFLAATGLEAKRTSIHAPWQNGTAERWIGSCRREILDYVVPVNEEHLRRVIREYVCYHQEDRLHGSLNKDTPSGRPIQPRPVIDASLTALPRLGGLTIGTAGGKRRRGRSGCRPRPTVSREFRRDRSLRRIPGFSFRLAGRAQRCRNCLQFVPVRPFVSALLRGSCGAQRLRSLCFAFGPVPVLAPPVAVPPEKQLLVLGAAPTRFPGARDRRAEQEKRMYLNRITLIGFLGGDAERKVSNATNIAVFSLATKTSWKNDAGTWESRTEWHRCVAFGRLAEFAATLTKGAHVAVEGELRSHEYQREIAVAAQTTSISQRVWEIRVESVLKLDRAAKQETTGDGNQEVPR